MVALPPHVVSGQPIASSWGNTVVDDLTQFNSDIAALYRRLLGFAWNNVEQQGIQQSYVTLTGTTLNFTLPATPPGATQWYVHIMGNSTFRKASGDSNAEVALALRSSWGGGTLTSRSENPVMAPGNTGIDLRSLVSIAPGSYSVYLQAVTIVGYVNAGERMTSAEIVGCI